MTTAAGWESFVAYEEESTPGTWTTPTFALELVSSTLGIEVGQIVSSAMKSTRQRQFRRRNGLIEVKGNTLHELSSAKLGKHLKRLMGAVATTGVGPYQHVFTDGPLVEGAMSIQVAKPDGTGTLNPHNYTGCQLLGSTWVCKTGNEFVKATWDWYGQHMLNASDGDVVPGLVTATYPAAYAPFSFVEAVLTINGAEYEFDDITLNFKNALKTGRHAARTTTPRRPRVAKINGFKETTATLNSEHYSNAVLLRALAGSEVTLSLVFTNSVSDKLQVAGSVRTMVKDPSIDGPDILKEGIELVFTSTSSDASACTVTLTNSEATP